MADLKDIPASLMSAVRDVVNTNQNLFQKDLENRYGVKQPEAPAQPEDEIVITDEE